jgi:hypothetical protein
MKRSIEVNWSIMGAELVEIGSPEQTLFFKGFARELMSWPTRYQKEFQAVAIAEGLSETEKEELKTFMECLWFKEISK